MRRPVYLGIVIVIIVYMLVLIVREHEGMERSATDFGGQWEALDRETLRSRYESYARKADAPAQETGTEGMYFDSGFQNVLPSAIPENSSLNFLSHNVDFVFLVGGEERYRYQCKRLLTGEGYGRQLHHVLLSPADSGAEAVFLLHGKYPPAVLSDLESMTICSPSLYTHLLLDTFGPSYVLSAAIAIIGCIVLLCHFFFDEAKGLLRLDALGVGMILLGLWTSLETPVTQLIFYTPVVPRLFTFISLLLFPYPLVVFFDSMNLNAGSIGTLSVEPHSEERENAEPKGMSARGAAGWLFPQSFRPAAFVMLTGILLCVILACVVFRMDMRGFTFLIYLQIAADITFILIMMIRSILFYRRHKLPDPNRLFYVATVAPVVGMLLDYLFSFASPDQALPFRDDGFFVRLGLMVFVLLSFAKVVRLIEQFVAVMNRERDERELLEKYSYTDQLTGALNRHALERYMSGNRASSAPVGILMCDINGLKQVNDREGHEAGDRLILAVAKALQEVFGAEAVYRMGGDEFLAIADHLERNAFTELIAEARRTLSEHQLNASIGWEYGIPEGDLLGQMYRRADAKMYVEKNAYYHGENDRRGKNAAVSQKMVHLPHD